VPRPGRFPDTGRPVSSATFAWFAVSSNGCSSPGV
jgi:hypothetical protein